MEQPLTRKRVGANRLNVKHRKSAQRARVTNGATVARVSRCNDGRSAWCRRLRDLLESHVSDLGGWDNVSAAESALLRRAVTLIVELERRELAFAKEAMIDDASLSVYVSGCHALKRLLDSLGLSRRMRPVQTLQDYLRNRELELEANESESVEQGPAQ